MRVQIETTVVGVQYRALAEFRLELSRRETVEGLRGGAKQGGIDGFGVRLRGGTQGCRQGKGHHEVVHGQELTALPIEPLRGAVVLAGRAAAMTTGAGRVVSCTAVGTAPVQFTELTASAAPDGGHRLVLSGVQARSVARHQGGVSGVEHLGQTQGGRGLGS